MKKILIIIVSFIIITLGVAIYIAYQEKNKDDFVPVIKAVKDIININSYDKYDFKKNIKVTFGVSGGKITCEKKELVIGENTISCIATGNNKKSSSVKYTIINSTTYDKTAIFFGDSITAGFGSTPRGYSWVNYLKDNYDLKDCINAGISDYRVSTYDDPNKWLVDEVNNYKNNKFYDFVIMQGGINDLLYNTPLGSLSKDKNLELFDKNTYIGGLETYLYNVINNWPNAKIGYIITYYTPRYSERSITWSYEDYKTYYDATIKVLNKWNIKYLDLFNEEFTNIIKVNENTYLPDYLHLNNKGYDLVSPYIYDFMQSLSNYS